MEIIHEYRSGRKRYKMREIELCEIESLEAGTPIVLFSKKEGQIFGIYEGTDADEWVQITSLDGRHAISVDITRVSSCLAEIKNIKK